MRSNKKKIVIYCFSAKLAQNHDNVSGSSDMSTPRTGVSVRIMIMCRVGVTCLPHGLVFQSASTKKIKLIMFSHHDLVDELLTWY
jgi:hypothetical protein